MANQVLAPRPQLQTAVLFLVFNRPETTRQVFDAIRHAKPPRLYVAADGPRASRAGETQRAEQVRQIATAIDWPCEVKTLFREKNLGCKHAVSSGISWFFEHEEQGIILEDDCLPSQTFFWYCEELLNKYKEDNRIFHIDGCNFTGERYSGETDYDFSRYALIWGWATWRRAWKTYDINLHSLFELQRFGVLRGYFGKKIIEKYWLNNLYQTKAGFDTWDYQWIATVWAQNGLVIRPAKNLIKNIGFDIDATHTKSRSVLFEKMKNEDFSFPLKHPQNFVANFNKDMMCSRIRFKIGRPLYVKIFEKITGFFLR